MSSLAEQSLQEVFAAYDLGGEGAGALRYGKGHINDTFCAYVQTPEGECRRFILQRMSAAAFKHPDQLMANIVGVTDFLRAEIEKSGGDASRETMTVKRTKEGKTWFKMCIRDRCTPMPAQSCSIACAASVNSTWRARRSLWAATIWSLSTPM